MRIHASGTSDSVPSARHANRCVGGTCERVCVGGSSPTIGRRLLSRTTHMPFTRRADTVDPTGISFTQSRTRPHSSRLTHSATPTCHLFRRDERCHMLPRSAGLQQVYRAEFYFQAFFAGFAAASSSVSARTSCFSTSCFSCLTSASSCASASLRSSTRMLR